MTKFESYLNGFTKETKMNDIPLNVIIPSDKMLIEIDGDYHFIEPDEASTNIKKAK